MFLLVLAHPCSPRQRAVKWLCVVSYIFIIFCDIIFPSLFQCSFFKVILSVAYRVVVCAFVCVLVYCG